MPPEKTLQSVDVNNEDDDNDVEMLGKLHEHNTMLGGIARIGRVVKLASGDPADPKDTPRVLVQIGGSTDGSYIRNWLPWLANRAGYDAEWWWPELDEQVVVLAPSGNIAQGIILGSLYRGCLTFDTESDKIKQRDPVPVAEVDRQVHQRIYKDGSSISYDRNLHKLAVELKSDPAEAKKTLRFAATMDPEGAAAGTGKATFEVGDPAALDFSLLADSTGGKGGELKLVTKLKTTLIAGAADDPKVTVLSDATKAGEENMTVKVGDGTTNTVIKNDGTITLTSGETKMLVEKDKAITLNSGATKVLIEKDKAITLSSGATQMVVKNDDSVTLSANATKIIVKDGSIQIDAGSNNITVKGNVGLTGDLDVTGKVTVTGSLDVS